MSKKLYVGNLEYSVSSKELSEFISPKWNVTDCKVIEGKGFAFVTFDNSEAASEAKEQLNGQDFKGRPLKVDSAQENNNSRNNNSRSGGGRSQKPY